VFLNSLSKAPHCGKNPLRAFLIIIPRVRAIIATDALFAEIVLEFDWIERLVMRLFDL